MFEDALLNIGFAIVRIAGFVANALLLGLPALYLTVLRPGLDAPSMGDEARARMAARFEGLVQSALIASAIATLIAIVLQAVVLASFGGGRVVGDSFFEVFESSFGRWYLLRFPLLLGLATLLWGKVAKLVDPAPAEGRGERAFWVIWLVLALGLISTSSFSGHASVSSPRPAALINDIVHMASGATWFVGIVLLAVVMPDVRRFVAEDIRTTFTASVFIRFSSVALVAIGLVALTGTFNSLFNVAEPRDLWTTGYGGILAAKIGLFMFVLAIGAVNHFYVRRRLKQTISGGRGGAVTHLYKRTVAVELVLALLIFALTGALAGSARTRESSMSSPDQETSLSS